MFVTKTKVTKIRIIHAIATEKCNKDNEMNVYKLILTWHLTAEKEKEKKKANRSTRT